ncbi:coiled-coil-helix-coiled-coil-helix domain containing 6b isoform X3 [Cynoglossus semilaevis]|uniref:Coiled-coil-helix-coiled-coil-helix domain containing 6b n=1 Tax=Cynoglossus semilaevis TaxID=244447 RepID=A0A3P8UW13_CYNSE|nr:MICOS complex subunit mic25a-like isoform X3 [Cynoglossus semilaevis]
MGGSESTSRNMSFRLDGEKNVTVIEGVKISEDLIHRMREPSESGSTRPSPSPTDTDKPPPNSNLSRPSAAEIREELRKDFERQQTLLEEHLARLTQRERKSGAYSSHEEVELMPSLITERGKVHEEQERAKLLAKQLEQKEKELATISSFYKEQLEILEKKNFDIYKESAEQYDQAATRAEAHVRPRQSVSVCTDLQAQVLQCYRGNPQQTLHCSNLAKQYMTCVQQAKKTSVTNHG